LRFLVAKWSRIQVINHARLNAKRSGVTEGLKSSKDKWVSGQTFKSTLQDRVGTWFLEVQGLHKLHTQGFEVFAANHHSRDGVHRTRPSHSGNQSEFLAERAPRGSKFGPEVIEASETIQSSAVGQLSGVDDMCPKFSGTQQDPVTLVTQGFAAFSMGTPSKAFLRIKLNLEHGSKPIDSVSCLAHMVHIVQQDSPVVDIGDRPEHGVASDHPFVEELRQNQHCNARHGTSLWKSIVGANTRRYRTTDNKVTDEATQSTSP
jgi:hypothetical protein